MERVMDGGQGLLRRALSLALSVLLVLSCTWCFPYSAHAAEPDAGQGGGTAPAKEESEGHSPNEASIDADITQAWAAGDVTLDVPGTYFLSDDVTTSGTLTVTAPADAEIVVDLRGHKAMVRGEAPCAVNVGGSLGSVRIVDSTRDANAAGSNASSVALEAHAAYDGIAAIMANYALPEGGADAVPSLLIQGVDVDARLVSIAPASEGTHDCYGVYMGYASSDDACERADVALKDSSVSAAVVTEAGGVKAAADEAPITADATGYACAVLAATRGLVIGGAIGFTSESQAGAADLYGTVDGFFSVEGDAELTGSASVHVDGYAEGTQVATWDLAEPEAQRMAASFTCADADAALQATATGLTYRMTEVEQVQSLSMLAQSLQAMEGEGDDDSAEEDIKYLDDVLTGTGKSGSVTISTGGTYVLDPANFVEKHPNGSDFLSYDSENDRFVAKYALTIEVKSGDAVTIDLRGHQLVFEGLNNSTATSAITVTKNNKVSVTITGNGKGTQRGAVYAANGKKNNPFAAVLLLAHAANNTVTVNNLDVRYSRDYVRSNTDSNDEPLLATGGVSGVSVTGAGTVELSDCAIEVDVAREKWSTEPTNATSSAAVKTAVKAATGNCTLNNVTLKVTTPAAYPMSAYGFQGYTEADADSVSKASLIGCTFDVSSPGGDAVAAYCNNVAFSGNTSILVDSPNSATGILVAPSPSAQSYSKKDELNVNGKAAINGSIAMSGDCSPSAVTLALSSCVVPGKSGSGKNANSQGANANGIAKPFELGDNFSGENLTVTMTTAAGAVNPEDEPFAVGAEGVDVDAKDFAACFVDGSATAANDVAWSSDKSGLVFKIKEGREVARLNDKESGKPFATVGNALAGADGSDDVVYLVNDPPDGINLTASSGSYAVNLNGHRVPFIANTGAASLKVVGSGDAPSATGHVVSSYASTGSKAYNAGAGSLELDGVRIWSDASFSGSPNGSALVCNAGTGAITLKGSTTVVSRFAESGYVSALGNMSTGSVTVEGAGTSASVLDSDSARSYGYWGKNGSTLTVKDGASVAATATQAAWGAYAGSNAKVAVENASISGVSTGGSSAAYGIQIDGGTVSVTRDSASDAADVTAKGALAYGLEFSGAAAQVKNARFVTEGEGFDIASNNAARPNDYGAGTGTLNLSGTCQIGAIALSKAITLQDFGLASGSSAVQLTHPDFSLANGVYATGTGLQDASAALFAASSTSSYCGYESKVGDGGANLRFESQYSVTRVREGAEDKQYTTLAEALSDSDLQDGDILKVTQSNETYKPLPALKKTVTVELADGTTTTVHSAAAFNVGTSSVAGNLTVKGPGKLSFALIGTDSSNNVIGMNVQKGSLVLDGVTVEAVYGRTGPSGAASLLCGVAVNRDTSLSMVSGAKVEAYASESAKNAVSGLLADESAAVTVRGVWAVDGGDVTVDETSSVSVRANGEAKSGSAVKNGDTMGESKGKLREINPAEGSALYEAIQDAFFYKARYLANGDSVSGTGFGLRHVYYASGMVLDDFDGLVVYAVSKYVPQSQAGDPDLVKAEKMFVLSEGDTPATAQGIASSAVNAASVTLKGTVDVSSRGNAYGLASTSQNIPTTWTVDGGTITVAAGEGAYHGDAGTIDLTGMLDDLDYPEDERSGLPSPIPFPSQGDSRSLVADVPYEAFGVSYTNSPNVTAGSAKLAGNVSITTSGANPADVSVTMVTVADNLSSVKPGGAPFTVLVPGGNFPEQEYATSESGAALTQEQVLLFADATAQYSSRVDDEGKGAWGGSYTVTFEDERSGALATHEGLALGDQVQLPDRESFAREDDDLYVWTFDGWHLAVENDKDPDKIDVDASAATVTVAGDARYVAHWTHTPLSLTVTMSNVRNAEGTASTYTFPAAYGQTIGDAELAYVRDQEAVIPSPKNYTREDGKVACFVGWTFTGGTTYSGRVVSPSVIDGIVLDYRTGSPTLRAQYVTVDPATQALVTFRNGDYVAGMAVAFGGVPSATAETTSDSFVSRSDSDATYTRNGYVKGLVATDASTAPTWSNSESLPTVEKGHKDDASLAVSNYQYSLCFTATQIKSWIQFYYYKWSTEDKSYVIVDPYSVTRGTDVKDFDHGSTDVGAYAASLVEDGSSFTQDGMTYTFLGWSTRKSDMVGAGAAKAMYASADLPAADGRGSSTDPGTSYYGVYAKTRQTVTVKFVGEDGAELGSMSFQPIADGGSTALWKTIAQAQAEANVSDPEAQDSTERFDHWTNGSGVKTNGATSVEKLLGDGDEVVLHPVFDELPLRTVTLHRNSGNTAAWTKGEAWKVDVQKGSTPAAALAATNFTVPWDYGMFFAGWNTREDGQGDAVDLATYVVDEPADIYATYLPINASSEVAGSVSASTAAAYVLGDGAVGSDGVRVSVEPVEAAGGASLDAAVDGNLFRERSGNVYDSFISAYSFKVGYGSDAQETDLTSGFGTVALTVQVADGYEENPIHYYVLREDGTVYRSGALTRNDDGSVNVPVSSYALATSGANLALAAEQSSDQKKLAQAQSSALQMLQEAYDKSNEADYTDENWTALTDAFNKGQSAVRAATSVADVDSVYEQAMAAMAAVPGKAGLASAKASALESLAESLAGKNKAAYDDDGWAALEKAYEEAKAAVSAAGTAQEATAAGAAGVLAMSGVATKAAEAVDGTSGGAGTTGTKSGSSTGNTTSSSSGTTSASRTGGLTTTGSTGSSSGLTLNGASSGSASSANVASELLGATVRTVDSALASQEGLGVQSGVLIDTVGSDGAAAKAGLMAGDVITAVDGEAVGTVDALIASLEGKKANDSVELSVFRNGAEIPIDLVLDKSTDEARKAADADAASLLKELELQDEGSANDASGESSNGGVGSWLADYWPLVVALAVLVIAAVVAIAWWLLRRRKAKVAAEDADFDADLIEGGLNI